MDLYETLGVPNTATDEEIQAAYRQAAKKAHPDAGGSPEEFQNLTLARDTLSDPESREVYDRTGQTPHEDPKLPAAIMLIRQIACECAAQSQTQNLVGAIREALKGQLKQAKTAASKYRRAIEETEKMWESDEIRKQVLDQFESNKLTIEHTAKIIEAAQELMKNCKHNRVDTVNLHSLGEWSPFRFNS